MGKYRKIKTRYIKDGLLKMILFTNLEDVKINGKAYNPIAVLKLTTEGGFKPNRINHSQKSVLNLLSREAKINTFKIVLR